MESKTRVVVGGILCGIGTAVLLLRPRSLVVPWQYLDLPVALSPGASVAGSFTARKSAPHEAELFVPRACTGLSVSDGIHYPEPLPLSPIVTVSSGEETVATVTLSSLVPGGHTTGEPCRLSYSLLTFAAQEGHDYRVRLSFQSAGSPVNCDATLDVSLSGRVRERLLFLNAYYTTGAGIPVVGGVAFLVAAWFTRNRGSRATKVV
jgi:hypothetical protein